MLALNATLPGIESITSRGLVLAKQITVEEYRQQGEFIKACGEAARLWAVDWRQQGKALLGEVATEIAVQLAMDFDDMLPAQDQRTEKLSAVHHFVAAKSDDPARWLAAAEEHGLTPRQLMRSIEAGTVLKFTPTPGGTQIGVPTLGKAVMEFQLYARRTDPETMTKEQAAAALTLLAPFLAWVEKVRART